MHLAAGTVVSRILNEFGQLRVQVRELSAELDEARAELAEREEAPTAPPAQITRPRPAAKRRPRKAS
jgi:hypothetical protein